VEAAERKRKKGKRAGDYSEEEAGPTRLLTSR